MVQHVFTPWKDRRELLMVRQQFYPDHSEPSSAARSAHAITPGATTHDDGETCQQAAAEKQHAVSRVSMWMQRGGCPHMVESTALLVAAMLTDQASNSTSAVQVSSYAVRAAYSAAFSRFVTGLLDSHQDKQHKLSMYSVARTIGLPATFVELRHQATHEQLPSLTRLRAGAGAALAWIWNYYWKHLGAAEDGGGDASAQADVSPAAAGGRACKAAMAKYLDSGDSTRRQDQAVLRKLIRRWGKAAVLRALDEIGDEAVAASASGDPAFDRVLRALWLSKRVVTADDDDASSSASDSDDDESEPQPAAVGDAGRARSREVDLDALKAELEQSRQELALLEKNAEERQQRRALAVSALVSELPDERRPGWSLYKGEWRPQPIGTSQTFN